MSVAEELKVLRSAVEELEEKYCMNCQEWDCDYCGYQIGRSSERRDE